jgi:flagellar hook protein FlgE
MFTSFSTALSALAAHSTAIDVVGNNLANLNTPGFKTSTVVFFDLVTQSLGAGLGETQVGFGVARPVTLRQFSQGAISSSTAPLDAAIQGDGFLVVQDAAGATLYARGGSLQVDRLGALLTATGERVQGWFAGATGTVNTSGAIGDIVVPVGTLKAAVASTGFSFDMNLDAAAQVNGTFSASIEVYDSLGVSHQVTVDFSKAAANQWDYSISIPQADLQQSQTFQPVTGQLIFDDVGSLDMTQTQPPAAISIQGLASGAATLTLDWQLLNGTVPRLTQYAQSCAISANAQDGSPAAQLTRVALGDGGKILAQYSNGQQIVVGQLAMASIRNPGSLIAVGNNAFQLSARSALPAIGVPGTGGRGLILGGAIEYSNVDIAREFTNLIVLQRGYQANARVVTTVDELSQDTINLKR